LAASLYGQRADYQRYDLVRKQSELILESGVKTWTEGVNGFHAYGMNLGVQGEYTFLTHHTAETTEYAAREGVYSAGSGRYSAGVGVSVTDIRDPVMWHGSVWYDVGLPKEERFYRAMEPGGIEGFHDGARGILGAVLA
jgi:hypothetical protein